MEWIGEFLEEREEEIRALPLVDYDAAIETHNEHVGVRTTPARSVDC